MSSKLKVVLLYGGNSSEREISIKSGRSVEKALKKLGYRFLSLDPIEKEKFIKKLISFNPDVVFITLHGKGGEDGTIQGVLDFLGYKYTGSPLKASAIAIDKAITKDIVKNYGVTVPDSITVFSKEEALSLSVDFPKVVKVATEGSSIGVFIVSNLEEYKKAVEEAFKIGDKVLIEEFIEGRELTVGILNGNPLDIIEIKVEKGFYDYKNKYFSDQTQYICPADIDKKLYKKIQEDALTVYKVLGCKGAARVDFLLKENIPYFLEINTIPGLTDHSLLPKAAAYRGISFEKLVEEMIKDAVR